MWSKIKEREETHERGCYISMLMHCCLVLNITKRLNKTKKTIDLALKKEPMCAWGGFNTNVPQHTHTLKENTIHTYCTDTDTHTHTFTFSLVCTNIPTPLCICNNPRKCTHTQHTNPCRLVQINCFPVVEGLSWGTLREQSTAHGAVSLFSGSLP